MDENKDEEPLWRLEIRERCERRRQLERAELFKQVAVACIRYCTEYVEPEFSCDLGTANKITEQILKASKQFAQKAEGEND